MFAHDSFFKCFICLFICHCVLSTTASTEGAMWVAQRKAITKQCKYGKATVQFLFLQDLIFFNLSPQTKLDIFKIELCPKTVQFIAYQMDHLCCPVLQPCCHGNCQRVMCFSVERGSMPHGRCRPPLAASECQEARVLEQFRTCLYPSHFCTKVL